MNLTPAAVSALANNEIENFIAAVTPGGILAQEAAGQRALVESAVLPKDAPWEQLGALGIKRGKDADDIFVYCELPAGWKKVATEHSMHSHLLDDKGRKRAGIFYKAAFYDRHAHMNLVRRFSVSVEPVGGWDDPNYDNGLWHCAVKDGNEIVWQSEPIGPKPKSGSFGSWWDQESTADDLGKAWINEHYPDWKNPLAYWD